MEADCNTKDTFHTMFGERQDLFRTSISSRRVCAAEVGHSLLSSICTLFLLFSLSVQQSFDARTPMLRFATKELCGCQIALSYGHQTRCSLLVNDIQFGMIMGVQETILCPWGKSQSTHYSSCHTMLLPTLKPKPHYFPFVWLQPLWHLSGKKWHFL